MRFSALPLPLGLALTMGMLAACDGGPAGAPTAVQTGAPQAQPATVLPAERAAPPPPKVAIAQPQGRPPREITTEKLLPLSRIFDIARRRMPGEIIDVELDDDDDEPPEYELEILTADGRSIDMKIDARSGAIREVEED